jgi:hypothetical protein
MVTSSEGFARFYQCRTWSCAANSSGNGYLALYRDDSLRS